MLDGAGTLTAVGSACTGLMAANLIAFVRGLKGRVL
jgi:hypothetical protein